MPVSGAAVPTTIQKAETALSDAQQAVETWEGQARDAQQRIAQLEADGGAAILAAQSASDIAAQINTATIEANALESAAAEARRQVTVKARELLGLFADDAEKRASSARDAALAHEQDAVADLDKSMLAEIERGK